MPTQFLPPAALSLRIFCGSLAIGLAVSLASPLFAQEHTATPKTPPVRVMATFKPPTGAASRPKRTAGAGTRNAGQCPQDSTAGYSLTALDMEPQNSVFYPTFRIQIPQTSAKSLEFSLFAENGAGIYQTSIDLKGIPETIAIDLPQSLPALQPDQPYQWVISLVCQPSDRLQDRSISGWLDQVEASPAQGILTK